MGEGTEERTVKSKSLSCAGKNEAYNPDLYGKRDPIAVKKECAQIQLVPPDPVGRMDGVIVGLERTSFFLILDMKISLE